ncbi:sensor histidine kinase [Melittangium boletus]|uniref:histidine kinase n=1 Tax=Melittangium boletus DSM 14713 TaxID=1294270 RepID=A0A250IK55_9BACT|nr:ATP-binding protein [Melittangium boletus]ATB31600.1 hybrid sensor histidine kinase/response regulator [Melittangium boletus DSM 14713]
MNSRLLTLLLVEDSPEDRDVFRTYLEEMGEYSYRFIEEESADNALAYCKREQVDCILLDYDLPELSGLEFLRRLVDEEGLLRPPVVMVTGRGSERIAVEALKGGASDYLVKSEVTPESLYRAVRNAVEKEDIRKRLTEQRALTGIAEARLQAALEVLERGQALMVLDRDFRILLVNSSQERLSQRKREETLTRSFWEVWPELVSPKGKSWAELHRVMSERVTAHFEDFFAPLSMWIDVSVYPTREGGIAIFFRDISEKKQAEERARAEERRRSEFEQQLIGIVSHDLRNPITAISLGVSLLLRRDDLDERILKTLVRVHSSAERTIRMVRDLLDFTQARLGGGIVIHREMSDLHPLLRLVVDEVQMSFPDREVRIEMDGDGQGAWDTDRVAQVITNLVSNALKYSPAGTPVTVRAWGDRDAVRMEVHNLGEPIPRQVQEHLFEPMRRGNEQSDRTSRSIGLGLFIVDHLIRAHGGTVDVRSTSPEGTTFGVRLPRRPIESLAERV